MALWILLISVAHTFGQHAGIGRELTDIQKEILPAPVGDADDRQRADDSSEQTAKDIAVPYTTREITHPEAPATAHLQEGDFDHVRFTGDWSVLARERLLASLRMRLNEAHGDEDSILVVLEDFQDLLVDRGYLLAKLSRTPPATAQSPDVLEVDVDVGRFGALSLWQRFHTEEGDSVREPYTGRYFSEPQIRRRFADFSSDREFNYREFYRRLYDLNMHPDLTLHTRLRYRQADQRYIDMELDVEEQNPVHVILEVNNTGTESTKEWRAGLTFQHLNPLRRDDVLTFRNINASDFKSLNSFALSYRFPYRWRKGGAITGFGGYSRIDSGEIAQDIRIRGSGWFTGFQGAHRVVDTSGHLMNLGMGLVYRNMEDQLIFAETAGRSREAESLPMTFSISYASKQDDRLRGRNYLTLETTYNLGALVDMSSDDAFNDLRQHAVEAYAIQRVQFARLQSLYFGTDIYARKDWSLFVKIEGQYADGALIPAEQFAVGGMNSVRGYEERALLGDHGGTATVELRAPIVQNILSRPFQRRREADARTVDRLQLLLFADTGFISRADLLQGEERTESLYSAGIGLRWAFSRYAQFRADVGYRFEETYNQEEGVGFHMSAQVQY